MMQVFYAIKLLCAGTVIKNIMSIRFVRIYLRRLRILMVHVICARYFNSC